jgi:hypothetical protein
MLPTIFAAGSTNIQLFSERVTNDPEWPFLDWARFHDKEETDEYEHER